LVDNCYKKNITGKPKKQCIVQYLKIKSNFY